MVSACQAEEPKARGAGRSARVTGRGGTSRLGRRHGERGELRFQQNPALARSQTSAGMWVGNHSWTHPHLTQMSASQISSKLSRTQQAIQQATGQTPRLFRPPYGETNGTVRSVEAQLGLTEVLWTVDSRDWAGASTSQIVQAAGTLQPGSVILMHDGYQTTINAIPQIVANLNNRNLCAGMISPTTGRAVAPV